MLIILGCSSKDLTPWCRCKRERATVSRMVQTSFVLQLSDASVCRLWRWLPVTRTSFGLLGRTQRSANMILAAGRPDIFCLPLTPSQLGAQKACGCWHKHSLG